MNAQLQAIKDAWDREVDGGRDTELAVSLSDEYVADHPASFASYENVALPDLVRKLEAYRAAEDDELEWTVQVWIFHRFNFQDIGGPAQAQIRLVP